MHQTVIDNSIDNFLNAFQSKTFQKCHFEADPGVEILERLADVTTTVPVKEGQTVSYSIGKHLARAAPMRDD